MIKNQRQYNVTKKQIEKLKTAIEVAHQTTVQMPAEIFNAMIAGIESQIEDMEQEIGEYEKLSQTRNLPIDDFSQIGPMLIQARIAKGLTQTELAEKCGLKSQQIQRYEETSYVSASLERLNDIVKALDVSFSAVVDFHNRPMGELVTGWDVVEMACQESNISIQNISDHSWSHVTMAESIYKIAG